MHSVNLNDISYNIPDQGDFESTNWGGSLTSYFDAIAASTLQKSGGSFTLTAEANFGTSFGLAAITFRSTGTLPATSGTLRLIKTDHIDWRNNANSANLPLGVNASDRLQFNGIELVDLSSVQTLSNKTITGLSIGGFTSNRAIVSSPTGFLTTLDSVTTTEVGYLAGLSSSIQSQINVATDAHAAHLANLSNPHVVTKSQVGLSNVENTKVNLTAVVAPTVNEDSGDGYSIGSRWINTVTDKEYVATDVTVGAALWVETTATGGAGTPGGSTTQVQFNDAGSFGGDAGFVYNKTTDTATIDTLVLNNALAIAYGGTGATSAVDAFNNLSPLSVKGDLIVFNNSGDNDRLAVGTDGFVLTADSTQAKGVKWAVAGGSTIPGGSDTQIQFNDSSAFGGDAGFTYNKTTDTASLVGDLTFSTTAKGIRTAAGYALIFTNTASAVNHLNITNAAAANRVNLKTAGSDTAIGFVLEVKGNELFDFRINGTSRASLSASGLGLATDLAITEGGTGQSTANAAFGALGPLTTKGDLLQFTTVNARLAVGTHGQKLTADAASAGGFKWGSHGVIRRHIRFGQDFMDHSAQGSWPAPFFVNGGTTGGITTDAAAQYDATTVGVAYFQTGTHATDGTAQLDGSIANSMFFGGGEWICTARFYLPDLSTASEEYRLTIGWAEDGRGGTTDGVYLEYLRTSSVNWRFATANNGTITITSSSVAVTEDVWHLAKIVVNAAGTSVEYFMDGVSLGTQTLTIPTTLARATRPWMSICKTAGTTNRTMSLDFLWYDFEPTTAY